MSIGIQLLLVGLVLGALINIATYEAFRWDKYQAKARGWRVPEATLLGLALWGGWFGAKLAQRKFRHKTRKMPFRRLLNLIPIFWIALGLLLMQTPLGDWNISEALQTLNSKHAQPKTNSAAPHRFFKRVGN
ncbi:MAG: uncharacterized membrane protein YsdA (DUF1294 family) [Paracoccaceae bacterium]|jgi:uncharacterized membrane protein YsdA (DUF1294 family)